MNSVTAAQHAVAEKSKAERYLATHLHFQAQMPDYAIAEARALGSQTVVAVPADTNASQAHDGSALNHAHCEKRHTSLHGLLKQNVCQVPA